MTFLRKKVSCVLWDLSSSPQRRNCTLSAKMKFITTINEALNYGIKFYNVYSSNYRDPSLFVVKAPWPSIQMVCFHPISAVIEGSSLTSSPKLFHKENCTLPAMGQYHICKYRVTKHLGLHRVHVSPSGVTRDGRRDVQLCYYSPSIRDWYKWGSCRNNAAWGRIVDYAFTFSPAIPIAF